MSKLDRPLIDSYHHDRRIVGTWADCPKCVLEIKIMRDRDVGTRGVCPTKGDWMIVGCEDCQGTVRDLIPWTELFNGNRYYSRTFTPPKYR